MKKKVKLKCESKIQGENFKSQILKIEQILSTALSILMSISAFFFTFITS